MVAGIFFMPGRGGRVRVEHGGELLILKFNVVLYLCPREEVRAKSLRRGSGRDSRVVQGEVTLEQTDCLPDDAWRLVAGEGNGVEVNVHGGGVVIILI